MDGHVLAQTVNRTLIVLIQRKPDIAIVQNPFLTEHKSNQAKLKNQTKAKPLL